MKLAKGFRSQNSLLCENHVLPRTYSTGVSSLQTKHNKETVKTLFNLLGCTKKRNLRILISRLIVSMATGHVKTLPEVLKVGTE